MEAAGTRLADGSGSAQQMSSEMRGIATQAVAESMRRGEGVVLELRRDSFEDDAGDRLEDALVDMIGAVLGELAASGVVGEQDEGHSGEKEWCEDEARSQGGRERGEAARGCGGFGGGEEGSDEPGAGRVGGESD